MPNGEIGGFRYVVQIVGEVLRMYSNLIAGVYSLVVLCIERQDYLENLKGKSDGDIRLNDGAEGSDNVSGKNDNVVSDEISVGSFTKFGSPGG